MKFVDLFRILYMPIKVSYFELTLDDEYDSVLGKPFHFIWYRFLGEI